MLSYSNISSVSALIEVSGFEDRREVQWKVKGTRDLDFSQEAFQFQKGNLQQLDTLFAYQIFLKISCHQCAASR